MKTLRKKLLITVCAVGAAALAAFLIYRLNCETCASGGTFHYGAPSGMQVQTGDLPEKSGWMGIGR